MRESQPLAVELEHTRIERLRQSILEPGTGTVYSAEQMGGSGLTVISDADIESAGGIAYTLEQEIAVAAVSVTTVSLPEVSVTVTGGRWADRPALETRGRGRIPPGDNGS